MKIQKLALSAIASLVLLNSSSFAENTKQDSIELDPVVVTSDFRSEKLSKTSNTVSILNYEKLADKSSAPFESVIGQVPNINFTSGASRAHYIQIRGIGERSQFISPINPSVGLIIDGIDMSDSALALTMWDLYQIEVLKGPQGTTFGSNGMAGVVNLISNEPTNYTQGSIEATYGNYDTRAMGFAVGGPIIENKLLTRISTYLNKSDGFIENDYLNKDNTQNIDELTSKVHFKYLSSDNHTIDLNFMHVNVDNGYDAFNFDNSRVTQSDEPGTDAQETNAVALKSTYQISRTVHLESKATFSKSDSTYSYDEDWSYIGFDPIEYSSFDEYLRDREKVDLDFRLISDEDGRIFNNSTDWTVGLYYKNSKEDLKRNNTYFDSSYISSFDTENYAVYSQLDSSLTDKLILTTGLRVENWDAKFSDSDNLNINTDEILLGGKIGLSYQENENSLYYITLSKGYKPGGVNPDNSLPSYARDFKTEHLWNLDIGRNFSNFDNRLKTRINAFYGIREDQQVKSSYGIFNEETQRMDWKDYLANAAKGSYYGLEIQTNYYPNDSLHLFANLGLLKSEFDEYENPDPDSIDLEGRAPAQSPEYQYNVGFDFMLLNNIQFKADVEGKDSHYFSNSHNEESSAYTLLNTSISYFGDDWTITLWGKNLTDEIYETRGFYFEPFGNNPANGYIPEEYTQLGDPRTFGITLRYDF